MKTPLHYRIGVLVTLAFGLSGMHGVIAGSPAQPPSSRDVDALIRIVHRIAESTPVRNLDIETIAVVKPFAVVEWYAQPTRQWIAAKGGAFVAREHGDRWEFAARLPSSYSAATLTHLISGLTPANARVLIDAGRIGLILQGCSRAGACRSVTQEIAFAVVHDALYLRSLTIAPVVTPVVRNWNIALADYTAGESGGEAMLQRTNARWKILAMGGGSLNSVRLLSASFRISISAARALVSAMKKNEAETYSGLCAPQRRCVDRARSATLAFSSRFANAAGTRTKAVVRSIAISGSNALLYYSDGKTGGEALLQLRDNRWRLLAMGPASLAGAELLAITFGISPTNAARLAYKMTDMLQR